ncbi:serine/threonine-protein kinase [Wenzhouxiangella sp. EGI_FJ10409]|uniref:serine/threonine-protein kinase n=1 Tax=Wenzhouxiangella sp. EGI_FJ10409 TaxID=3243767 RepID=UPI0035D8B99E
MGEVLGRYHIISELGRGGMGVVYKALDPKLERFIAIKCLNDELSADEIVVARFLREARSVAALNHPNIAQIYVADEHDGKPYFVMEYVDGESLADFIDREGQCSPEMARRMTEQAANALSAAAEEGIVHRDVKPGNIMIDRRGRAVLTDFGIACVAAEQSDAGSKTIMGTPGYLAPEALSGGPVDSRSDMFALGAVWYEMLTGERLMPGRDLKDTFRQLAGGEFPDLSALEGKADERVIDILRKLLAIQPENRFSDWSAMLAEMAPLKTGRTGPVQRGDTGPSTAEREVTAALATGRMSAKTATIDRAAEATAVVQTQTEGRHPVPVQTKAPKRRGRLVALLLVLVLALSAAGFGLARLDPSTWNRVTAWLPGGEEAEVEVEADSGESRAAGASREGEGAPADAAASLRAGQALTDGSDDGSGSADTRETDDESNAAEGSDAAAPSAPDADDLAAADDDPEPSPVTPEVAGEPEPAQEEVEDDRQVAMADSETVATAAPATSSQPPERAAPPPRGVVVIGLGDPVIADPMVREIEAALRGGSHPLVQRSFVRGYRDYIQGEELDLAGLADPAREAGARYVVVARALPAGERELQYYNRVETAYIAQLEAVTYDLHELRQMGTSPVEQIEFTALNATRRAEDSVKPWLPGIRDQFD